MFNQEGRSTYSVINFERGEPTSSEKFTREKFKPGSVILSVRLRTAVGMARASLAHFTHIGDHRLR
jgi:hypothetical protein